jgi:hypothetical protein
MLDMAITQLLKHLIEAERAIARRKPIPTSGTIPTTGRLTGQRGQDPSNVLTGELEEITGPGQVFRPNESGLERGVISKEMAERYELVVQSLREANPNLPDDQIQQMAVEALSQTRIPTKGRFQGKTTRERAKTIARNKRAAIEGNQKYMRRGNKPQYDQPLETFPGEDPVDKFIPRPTKRKSKKVRKGTGTLTSPRFADAEQLEKSLETTRFVARGQDEALPDEIAKALELKQQEAETRSFLDAKAREGQLDYFGDERDIQVGDIRKQLDDWNELFASAPKEHRERSTRHLARDLSKERISADAVSKRIDEIMKEVEDTFGALGGRTIGRGKDRTKEIKSDVPGHILKKAREEGVKDIEKYGLEGGEWNNLEAAMSRMTVWHRRFAKAAERARASGSLDEIEDLRERFMGSFYKKKQRITERGDVVPIGQGESLVPQVDPTKMKLGTAFSESSEELLQQKGGIAAMMKRLTPATSGVERPPVSMEAGLLQVMKDIEADLPGPAQRNAMERFRKAQTTRPPSADSLGLEGLGSAGRIAHTAEKRRK